MKEAYEAVSPFIEEHTTAVCPSCKSVCCIDRHGTHEEEDLLFIDALGEPPPSEGPRQDDAGPCRHLSPATGCGIQRWRRPFRCTWFFCQPLLDKMRLENPKEYRRFVDGLQGLVRLRRRLFENSAQDVSCGGYAAIPAWRT
jgi:hypothetical protein